MKILIIEDDTILNKTLSIGLKKLGYSTDSAFDGEEALILFDLNQYDAVILDLNLPKIDGLEVLKSMRKTDQLIGVLILSARCEVDDKIAGLDNGANDYLTKPFHFGELDARLRALTRRRFIQANTTICHGSLELNTSLKTVTVNGRSVKLTKKEYGILEYLALNKNKVVSAEELVEHVWDSNVDLFSNSFKVHIFSLKKKMAELNDGVDIIKNTRGVGYFLMEVKDENSK